MYFIAMTLNCLLMHLDTIWNFWLSFKSLNLVNALCWWYAPINCQHAHTNRSYVYYEQSTEAARQGWACCEHNLLAYLCTIARVLSRFRSDSPVHRRTEQVRQKWWPIRFFGQTRTRSTATAAQAFTNKHIVHIVLDITGQVYKNKTEFCHK